MKGKKLSDILKLIEISDSRLTEVYNSGVCSEDYPQLVNLIESIYNLRVAYKELNEELANNTKTNETPEM